MKFSNIFLFSFILLFFSCKTELNKVENVTKTYSYTDDFDESKIVNISLEETELNFKELTLLIGKKQNIDSLVALHFFDGNTQKEIIPFCDTYGHLGMRNTLRITKDSMLWQFENPINKLPEALKIHYENNGKNNRYSRSPDNAYTEISIDTSSTGKQLKETLSLLTKEFDILNSKHNDSLKLKVYFSFFRQLSPPPPPPKNPSPVINIKNEPLKKH